MILLDIRQFFHDNVENYAVEFSASLILYLLSIVFTSWITARRKRRQFYRNLDPVMRTLSMVRQQAQIDGRYVQAIVQSISNSFEENFLRRRWYDFIPLASRNEASLPAECWVCEQPSSRTGSACTDCKLDCQAWDKATLPRQMAIEKKIGEIRMP